jgi:N-acyl-D-amino-acid deacylase
LAISRSPFKRVQVVYDEAIEVVCDILAEDPQTTWALIKDKREAGTWPEFLKHPLGMPCGDAAAFPIDPVGRGSVLDIGVPPSAYNLMPNYLIQMVREKKFLTLPEAIRKITSLPAEILGIPNRGTLKEGKWADLVLMDWENLKVDHDFEHPNRRPEGIEYVFVNGTLAYQAGGTIATRRGQVLRKGRV